MTADPTPLSLVDILIAIALLWTAGRALFARDPFTGAVLYIAFGLLMSLAWVRLRAPDIALAEAAIGAGVTGALLIDATRHLARSHRRVLRQSIVVAGGCVALAIVLLLSVLDPAGRGLAEVAADRIGESGVSHPVTAVLLNYRAYDTWLETGVLLIAVIAAFAVRRKEVPVAALGRDEVADTLLSVIIPLLVLVGGLLLWRGTRDPGGAFQAGAVIGAAGILLLLLSRWSVRGVPGPWLRIALAGGFAAFLVAAVVTSMSTSALELRDTIAGAAITAIELLVMLSVASALALLVAAARSGGEGRS